MGHCALKPVVSASILGGQCQNRIVDRNSPGPSYLRPWGHAEFSLQFSGPFVSFTHSFPHFHLKYNFL